MKNLALILVLAACLLGCGGKGTQIKRDSTVYAPDTDTTFTDRRDGKVYKIVKIGRQTWFAENLNYAAEGSWCYKNIADSCAKYGRLYTWETALTACPAGTHLPTAIEWAALVDYAGGAKTAGQKLKSTSGWNSNNGVSGNGSDDYGFSALPGGGCFIWVNYYSRYFYHIGNRGFWWSATDVNNDAALAWCREIVFDADDANRNDNSKRDRYSVLCVLDDEKERRK